MVKELVEDVKRYMADREINARLVLVFDKKTNSFEQRPWRDVKVPYDITLFVSTLKLCLDTCKHTMYLYGVPVTSPSSQ